MGERSEVSGNEFDGAGRLLLPGLIDHHIHLLATAARRASTELAGLVREDEIVARLRGAASGLRPDAALRAVGYDERALGLPDRTDLDRWLPDRPMRIQDRTGALWLLNTRAIDLLGSAPWPDCVETDRHGVPTGRIWRGDAWLRERLGVEPPPVARLASELASLGIVGVTDAGAANGFSEAAYFEELRKSGDLPQKLQLMGDESLPESEIFRRGALKLHYDECDLPPLEKVASRIEIARGKGRAVAAHCVSEGELVYFLAALDLAGGARTGDRIEHGSLISGDLLAEIATRDLVVVTHPAFVHDRGDRYLETMSSEDVGRLYRLATLDAAGIRLAGGSDAPYGSYDPWRALRAARDRTTAGGSVVGYGEAMPIDRALELFLQPFDLSEARPRRIEPGGDADLCLVEGSWDDLRHDPHGDRVAATFIDGNVVFDTS